jgi:hypothetical protein
MFLTFFQVDASDDLIVVLKLWQDTDGTPGISAGDTFTTRAIVVDAGDMYLGGNAADMAALSGTAYATVAAGLGNQDAILIIESNDYNAQGENWQIVGAQIVQSPDGVNGTGINLVKGLGNTGASDADHNGSFTGAETQAFSTDTDTSGIKITSIGFVVPTTTAQTAHIDFNVTVQDGDGDTITQAIGVDVTSAANSSTAINPLPAANTTVAPVVLDLNGDGVHFLATTAGVTYDYNGDGVKEATAWAAPDDGLLVRDANHNGTVDNASEFVFGSGSTTDLQALAAYDTNHDGQLSSADADWGSFAVWQDANSNGVVDAGEMQSLTARGITSISLSTDGISYSAANDDVSVAGTGSYTNANGTTGLLADAAFLTGTRQYEGKSISGSDASTAVLAAALAAAGMAAQPAAASSHASGDGSSSSSTVAAVHNESLGPVADDGSSASAISQQPAQSAAGTETAAAATSTSHASDEGQSHAVTDTAPNAEGPAPLPQGTDSPAADQAPAASATAAAVAMPSAADLAGHAAGGGEGAAHNAVVGQVLADALQGGSGGSLDALINALPGNGGSALSVLASHDAGGVSNADMGGLASFSAMHLGFMMGHGMMVHQDAVQPHA